MAGVALVVANGQGWLRTERVVRGAEKRLLPWAVELLAQAGGSLADVTGVACADGPGAFTGLRVGLATAAGLAQALAVPLWTACSLDGRAHTAQGDAAIPVLAMLDARKSRVYAAVYQGATRTIEPADVAPDVALGWMTPPFIATGEGAVVYQDQVVAAGGQLAETPDDSGVLALAVAALTALSGGGGFDPVDVRPRYLREPDAKPPRR